MPHPKGKVVRDKYHDEVVFALHQMGAYCRSSVTGQYTPEEEGKADIYCLYQGGCAIEVKTGYDGTFNLETDWRLNQRQWAQEFKDRSGCEYWLALIYETFDTPYKTMRRSAGKLPRDAFLIPYGQALAVKASHPQDSVAYQSGPGMLVEIQREQLDALHYWGKFRLVWSQGLWQIPEQHPFLDRLSYDRS